MAVISSIKDLGMIALALICLFLFGVEVIGRGPTTLVEPIQVSEEFKKHGYSEDELQRMLIDALSELRSAAESVTPKPSDQAQASSDLGLPDISVPGTGSSVRPLIEYSRSLLGKDSSVSGSVAGSTAVFVMTLTLRESNGEVHSFNFASRGDEHSRGKPNVKQSGKPAAEMQSVEDVLHSAAQEIMKQQSLLTYAGYLTQKEQSRCIDHGLPCKFGPMREIYEQMAARESDGKASEAANPAWARLALAKLDVFDHNLEGAISHARAIVDGSDAHPSWSAAAPWGYYSWGVALNDLGCYERAAEVLQRAVEQNPRYAAAYNALASSYLELGKLESKDGQQAWAGSRSSHDYRDEALVALQHAIELDPNFQEAYVNLGDALRLPERTPADHVAAALGRSSAQNLEDARKAYRDAVALNLDTAARAYERLTAIQDTSYLPVKDRITRKQPRCRPNTVKSLLASWGCADVGPDPSAGRHGHFEHTALYGADKPPAVCGKRELILQDKASQQPPFDGRSTIVAAGFVPQVQARTMGPARGGALREESGQRQIQIGRGSE